MSKTEQQVREWGGCRDHEPKRPGGRGSARVAQGGPRTQSMASMGLEAGGLGEARIWGRGCVSSMGS